MTRYFADSWNEWITFPIRYCDLPLSSQITFTVWDIAGPRSAVPVGGSTFKLFGKKWYSSIRRARKSSDIASGIRTLRRGKHRLFLWAGREADGSDDSTTPSKLGARDEMGRLEKVCRHTLFVVTILTVLGSLSRSTNVEIYPSLIGSTT
jgi:phosphatidylinositol 3-kinase